MPEDGDRPPAGLKSAAVRRRVDPCGEAREDRDASLPELVAEAVRAPQPLGRRMAGADYRDATRVLDRQRTARDEERRRVEDKAQVGRIILVEDGQETQGCVSGLPALE